jgi:hypothetical protein
MRLLGVFFRLLETLQAQLDGLSIQQRDGYLVVVVVVVVARCSSLVLLMLLLGLAKVAPLRRRNDSRFLQGAQVPQHIFGSRFLSRMSETGRGLPPVQIQRLGVQRHAMKAYEGARTSSKTC